MSAYTFMRVSNTLLRKKEKMPRPPHLKEAEKIRLQENFILGREEENALSPPWKKLKENTNSLSVTGEDQAG